MANIGHERHETQLSPAASFPPIVAHQARFCQKPHNTRSQGRRPAKSLTLALLALLLLNALPASGPIPAAQAQSPLAGTPVWAAGQADEGAVALFRHRFSLPAGLDPVQLAIIADTRYEVWLDGEWVGRGPARFSRLRQEFDTFPLSGLSPGLHTLAVLVQYAPNTRRSESSQAALQADVRGWNGSAWQVVAATGSHWKATLSPAWDTASAPISRLDLIGPMEVLDLRRLSADWMQPAFDDTAWPYAQAVIPSPFPALSARTIPPLDHVPRLPVAVVESGLLSPGWQLVELEHPTGSGPPITRTLELTATAATILRLEALDDHPVRVDGGPALAWAPLDDPRRPDLLAAEQALSAGRHTLSVVVPPDEDCTALSPFVYSTAWPWPEEMSCTWPGGRTLAIALEGLQLAGDSGVGPVHNPGRRTLLANPVPGGEGAPQVSLSPTGAEVILPAGDMARYVVLDFGRTLHARLSLEANGPAGTILDAGWDERLTEGRPLPNPGSLVANLWSQVDSWVLDGTTRQLTTLDTRSGRYLLLQLFGPGPVTLRHIQAVEELYPATQVGWFDSSDELLDQVWQIGVDTLRPNMTDAYTDTPWRERGQWWGDALIAFHINRAAFGDLELWRRGLRLMADAVEAEGHPAAMAPNGQGMTILDYEMGWVEGLHSYWRLSGDLSLVAELYPAAQRFATFLAGYEGAAGLLDVPPAHWSQSALVDWPAVSSRSGESTALNAQYAALLRQMGDLAAALGDSGTAQGYYERSMAVQQAINAVLFLPEQGCYAASRLDGELVAPSPHAQAWALRYGIVPAERQASTAQALLRQLSPFFDEQGYAVVEPLGFFSVLEALGRTGHTAAALNLIRQQYGRMIEQGATTWWELFSSQQTRGQSLSHVWGGSPTWFLSAQVLGGLVTGPDRWQVAPHPGGLTYARGAVPLGGNVLEIDWQAPRCGQFDLSLTAPPGSSGDLLLPFTRPEAQVTLDGAVVWDGGPVGEQPAEMTDEGLLIAGLAGGEHRLTVTVECDRLFLPSVSRPQL